MKSRLGEGFTMRWRFLLSVLGVWLAVASAGAAAELIRSGAPVYAYVFNVGSKDVTIVDTATNEVRETRPLGASVRWLSNEQDFWDGELIWTYDLVGETVELIAIDPAAMRLVHRLPVGKGPAHSVMLSPDRRHVLINVAGDNLIAVVDREKLEIVRTIPTGLFPCDLDFHPNGKVGYVPERDQDTVASLDLETFTILERVRFPESSKPHMLRVAPDGGSVWVQAAAAGTNSLLDPQTLAVEVTEQLGQAPVTNAWAPDGRHVYVTHFGDNFVSVLDAKSGEEIRRIPVGPQLGNLAFRPDGKFAYVAVIGAGRVAVIDTEAMEVVKMLPAGEQPGG
jgi:YVTN family beta-propeller protein